MFNAPRLSTEIGKKKSLYNTDEIFIPIYLYEHLIPPLSMPKDAKNIIFEGY